MFVPKLPSKKGSRATELPPRYRPGRFVTRYSQPSESRQSRFAPRPFSEPAQEKDYSANSDPHHTFNFSEIDIFPRETTVQPKLKVGPAGDRYEREAEMVARKVVSTISKTGRDPIQRQDLEEEEEELMMEREGPGFSLDVGGGRIEPGLESAIQGARGGGRPLSDGVRRPMEQAFGADFGGVRLHTDEKADRLNRSIQARAFTTGQDIFLRQGEYRPGSSDGQRLLAHELTHVVQQMQGRVRPMMQFRGAAINENEDLEIEANEMGNQASAYKSKRYGSSKVATAQPLCPIIQMLSEYDPSTWMSDILEKEDLKKYYSLNYPKLVELAGQYKQNGGDYGEINEHHENLKNAIRDIGGQILADDKDIGNMPDKVKSIIPYDSLKEIKIYNFDGPMMLTAENVRSWQLLTKGEGTFNDLRYLLHEMYELNELKKVFKDRPFINIRPTEEPTKEESDFWEKHEKAHQEAIKDEVKQIAHALNVKPEDVAKSEPDEDRRLEYLYYMGIINDNDPVPEVVDKQLSKKIQEFKIKLI